MQVLGVVALEERLDHELPVALPTLDHRTRDHVVTEAEVREVVVDVGSEVRAHIERSAGREHAPHDAVASFAREREEPARRFVDGRERLAMGDVDEAPAEIVGPGVVAAGEGLGLPARRVDEPRAAMPAHVHERPRLAGLVARHEDRYARDLARHVAPRLCDLRRVRDGERHAAKESALSRRSRVRGVRVRADGGVRERAG